MCVLHPRDTHRDLRINLTDTDTDVNKDHNESDSERHKQHALNHLGQMTIVCVGKLSQQCFR